MLITIEIHVNLQPRFNQDITYFALNVGPTANLAKLLGKSGFPGIRSPTGSYGKLVFECKLPNEDDPKDLGRPYGEEWSVENEWSGESGGGEAGCRGGDALYARRYGDGEEVGECRRGHIEIFNPWIVPCGWVTSGKLAVV